MAESLAPKATHSPDVHAERDGGDGGDDADLAVLLIHGIGDIVRGDVLGMSVAAIRRHLPDVTVVGAASGFDDAAPGSPEGAGAAAERGAVSAVDLRWNDRSIRVVEYCWAPVVGKIRLGRPLLALRRMLETLRELPTMAAAGTPSPRVERWAPRAGRFQRAVVLWMILLIVPVVVELSLRPEFAVWLGEVLPTVGSDPSTNIVVLIAVRLWEGRYVFSMALAALYLLAGMYYGVAVAGFGYFLLAWLVFRRRLRPVGVFLRALAASSVLTSFVALGVMMVAGTPVAGLEWVSRQFEASGGVDVWSVASIATVALTWLGLMYGLAVKPALVVTNLLRDAVHYLATGPDGGLLPHQRTIRAELEALVRRLLGPDGRTHLVVVAHSLGTVIFTDLLRHRAGAMADDAEGSATLDLVTAGSPLRRLVHRLLPYRLPDAATLARELRRGPLAVRQWHNAYRLFDYVGQALTHSALPLDLLGWRRKAQDPASGIADQLLTPRYAWPLAHANYWGDARFLDFVAERVARPVLPVD